MNKTKKYKTNSFTAIIFSFLEIAFPFCFVIPIMIFAFGGDNYSASDALLTFPMTLFGVFAVALFFSALNLLTLPFKKHRFFLDETTISDGEKVIELKEIYEIKINSGVITRTRVCEHCALELYSRRELLMELRNPSFLMIIAIIHRCKGAKIGYSHLLRALIFLGVAVLLSSLAFFSK